MDCFTAYFSCFASNRRKSIPSKEYQGLRSTKLIQSNEQTKREEQLLIKLIRESKEEVENQDKCSSKKRVTFDLSIETDEEPSVTERHGFDSLENNEDEREDIRKEETSVELEPFSDTNELVKVSGSEPNYRYCAFEEKEEEEEYGDIDVADDEEESSESLFSLSLDSRKRACDSEIGENEVNSGPMETLALSKENAVKTIESSGHLAKRPRLDDESVLKPIENLGPWKDVVERRPMVRHLKHDDKENIISLEPSLKRKYHGSKPKLFDETKLARQEIGVDTSFSSWLIGSENSPRCPKNDKLLGDSMIRGIEQYSTRPVIGTVESYWVHTGQELDLDLNSSLLSNAN